MLHYIKELRESTNLTQKDFADKYKIPLSTLRKWEQGESTPPQYVVMLIEDTLPCYKEKYEIFIGENGHKYYLDKQHKRVADSLGNWISYKEDIEGVIKENIAIYLEDLFNDFYIVQSRFNDDLKYDKVNKVKWSK